MECFHTFRTDPNSNRPEIVNLHHMRPVCEKETTAKVDQLWITWHKI